MPISSERPRLSRRQFVHALATLPVLMAATSLTQACGSLSSPAPVQTAPTTEPARPSAESTAPTPTVQVGSSSATPVKSGKHTVAVLRCAPEESDKAVEDRLVAATGMVTDLTQTLKGKRKVLVKPNIGLPRLDQKERGRLHAIVDPGVLRATVAMIRQHYSGEIIIGEGLTDPSTTLDATFEKGGYGPAVRDFDVRLVNLDQPPYADFSVPGGGVMFSRYSLSQELKDVDFVVSLAKMKSHLCGGVTLTLKNFFGVPPMQLNGSPRRYFHQLIRLPRVLVDLGLILNPGLCIIDGLVGQNEKEWDGPPVAPGLLAVGDNTIATDAVAARLMGHDPEADYGQAPFYWDRNPLKIGVEAGLGSARVEDIAVKGDDVDKDPLPKFYVGRGPSDFEDRTREILVAGARAYLKKRDDLLKQEQLRGKIVGMLNDRLFLTVDSGVELGYGPRGKAETLWSGSGQGVFLKKLVPAEEEAERFEVYEGPLVPGA